MRPIGGEGAAASSAARAAKTGLARRPMRAASATQQAAARVLGSIAVAERVGDERQISGAPGGGREPPPGQRCNKDRFGPQVVSVRASSKAARKS